MPTTILLLAAIACLALHFIVPLVQVISWPWNWTGITPLLAGVWINLSADRAFKRAGTTVKPYEESTALIRNGVFRLSRNPMYLGFVGILLGIAILLGSLSPFIVVLVFPALLNTVFICSEERMLAERFGDEWKQYCT